jgi:hypothetical protein
VVPLETWNPEKFCRPGGNVGAIVRAAYAGGLSGPAAMINSRGVDVPGVQEVGVPVGDDPTARR